MLTKEKTKPTQTLKIIHFLHRLTQVRTPHITDRDTEQGKKNDKNLHSHHPKSHNIHSPYHRKKEKEKKNSAKIGPSSGGSPPQEATLTTKTARTNWRNILLISLLFQQDPSNYHPIRAAATATTPEQRTPKKDESKSSQRDEESNNLGMDWRRGKQNDEFNGHSSKWRGRAQEERRGSGRWKYLK